MLKVCSVVMGEVVGLRDVRSEHGARAADVVNTIGYARHHRSEENICSSHAGASTIRDSCVASETKISSRPRRGDPWEVRMLVFKTAFETVSAVDFRQVLGKLNGVADAAVRACKSTCTQVRKAADIYLR